MYLTDYALDVPKHSDSSWCIQGLDVYVPVPSFKTKVLFDFVY